MTSKCGALVKTSLVDYPGKVCATVFFKGCNLRCPYCYNAPLITGTADESELFTIEEIQNHLTKRRNVLDALTVSGGEALLNPFTVPLITFAKELGYLVKLDTNGTQPELLQKITENPATRPDFIAMDIKTSPENYHSLLNAAAVNDKTDYETEIKKSIEIISDYPASQREFRTVLVPTLIKKEDIKTIAGLLPKNSSWQFARFVAGSCLEKLYNALPPYTEKENIELVDFAKTFIKNAVLR